MMFLEHSQGFGGQDAIGNSQPPSLYELLMQDRMSSGFKPAIEYLTQILCDSYPHLSTTVPVQYIEESYALLKLLFERYFLQRYDGLASERFFGMKRVMYNANSLDPAEAMTSRPLTDKARRQSLLYAVLIPYLKTKLDNYHQQLVSQTTTNAPSTDESLNSNDHNSFGELFLRHMHQLNILVVMKKVFVKGYPFANVAYEGSFFFYHWLYLFGDTPYFSPFLRRMHVALVRVTSNDESALAERQLARREALIEALNGPGILRRLRRTLLRTSWALYDHSYVLLILGIAGYKFLEWMYSEEGAAKIRSTGTDAPIPPPPLAPNVSPNASILQTTLNSSTCPICQRKRVNPAASISGFVFCYPCLYRYVEEHGQCPATQIRCSVESITKIYDELEN